MNRLRTIAAVSLVLVVTAAPAVARDAGRSVRAAPSPEPGTPARAILNPYQPRPAAPGATSADRAGDAYATGFAIGLGSALIAKQKADEAKRREQAK